MEHKRRAFAFSKKEVDDRGEFSGYLSVHGVIDFYKEQVMRGAFEKTLKTWGAKGKLPPVLWQHHSWEPIGPFTKMAEDEIGLYVEGRLLIDDVPLAKQARALIANDVIDGMSIGFDVIVDEYNKETQILSLKEIDLWEGSIVTFPANRDARVEAVKSILGNGHVPSIRDLEDALRDVGFSQLQAKSLLSRGYAALARDVRSEERNDRPNEMLKSIVDELHAFTQFV